MEPYNLNSGRTGKSTSENYTVETFQENYAPKSSKPLKYSCENVDDESGSWSCVDGKVDTPGSFCDKCTYMFHPGWINVGTETEGVQGYDGASTSQEAFQSGSQSESSDPDNFIVVHRCQWYYIKTQDPRHTYCDNWVSIIGTSCYECLAKGFSDKKFHNDNNAPRDVEPRDFEEGKVKLVRKAKYQPLPPATAEEKRRAWEGFYEAMRERGY